MTKKMNKDVPIHTMHSPHAVLKGVLTIIGVIFIFASINTPLRALDQKYSVIQILLFRNLFGVVPLLLLSYIKFGLQGLKTPIFNQHLLRGVGTILSLIFLFHGLTILPISQVTVVQFTNTFFMILFARLFLKEYLDLKKIIAISIGFLGIYVVTAPTQLTIGSAGFDPNILYILLHAFIDGGLIISARYLAQSRPPLNMAFWDCLVALFLVLAIWLYGQAFPGTLLLGQEIKWVMPTIKDWIILIALGVGGGIGQYFYIEAGRVVPAQILAPITYTSLIWAIMYDILLFGDKITIHFILGSILIISCGLYVLYRGRK